MVLCICTNRQRGKRGLLFFSLIVMTGGTTIGLMNERMNGYAWCLVLGTWLMMGLIFLFFSSLTIFLSSFFFGHGEKGCFYSGEAFQFWSFSFFYPKLPLHFLSFFSLLFFWIWSLCFGSKRCSHNLGSLMGCMIQNSSSLLNQSLLLISLLKIP